MKGLTGTTSLATASDRRRASMAVVGDGPGRLVKAALDRRDARLEAALDVLQQLRVGGKDLGRDAAVEELEAGVHGSEELVVHGLHVHGSGRRTRRGRRAKARRAE
eukprot:15416078-Heterocapsa_arctica.AAC.1